MHKDDDFSLRCYTHLFHFAGDNVTKSYDKGPGGIDTASIENADQDMEEYRGNQFKDALKGLTNNRKNKDEAMDVVDAGVEIKNLSNIIN